jgi:hypothetical protein
MAKTFLPKKIVLTQVVVEQLKKDFKLSEQNLAELNYWNNADSPFSGVILGDNTVGAPPCYPYDKTEQEFKEEYPEGIVYREKN